ncbi:MAG TPA: extracellular solute-binding protein [Candidatus Binatia bacterium]
MNPGCKLFVVIGFLSLCLPVPLHSQESPIVQAARKEGEVVWYTTMSLDQSREFMDRFIKRYPFLKPSVFRSGGGALLNRMLSEAKGGKYLFDVAHGTGEIVLPLVEAGLLAPYNSPERKMIPDDLKDSKGYWTSVYVNSIVLGFNKNLVRKEDVPKTYEDLLLPRWKGRKISIDDSYTTFLQGLISVWGREKAVSYLKRLADQEPVIMRGSTVRVQLAAAGEFPLVLAYANIIQYPMEKGAPLDWVPLEPVIVSVNTVMLGAKAPHPNAAKLLVDFNLSKEGQEKLWDFQRIPARSDVEPKPARLFRGYKRYVVHPEEYKNHDEVVKLYSQILKTR